MKIAIEGCAHGELEKIYECIETIQNRENIIIDLLICCGDFQSVRNKDDMKAMAVPEKYQHINTFYKYYSGEKQAPVLTIFIGGNHEASNYLQELPYGGWVAPKIYYLGRAGVINFGNLRIGGISGIYKGNDYLQGLWENPPYNQNSLRSVYHIRALDVFRLSQLQQKVHIMLSHDWPRGITDFGDKDNLLRRKQFLRDDIEANQLGSVPAEKLLHKLKPDYWFSAHLHCQFAALVKHEDGLETKFLALDKCLPKRRHLQILDLPEEYNGDKLLRYDKEWLAVLRLTNHLLSVKNIDCHMPGPGAGERYEFKPSEEEKNSVENIIGNMSIDENTFVMTAPVYQPNSPKGTQKEPVLNPQTVNLCEKLGIDDPLQVVMARSGRTMAEYKLNNQTQTEISEQTKTPTKPMKLSLPAPVTPSNDELTIDSDACITFDNSVSNVSDDKSECQTPIGLQTKKSFKRRNQVFYSPAIDESSENSASVQPAASKKICEDS